MLRLHSHSSRSYTPQGGTKKSPGRPARSAPLSGVAPVMATCRGTGQESAEAIVGARKQARRKEKNWERLTPPKGRTQRREEPL